MLRELITWVLNTYLGKYLEDFNPAQLSVALLSGEVELENIPIRKDAFRSFDIPIQAISGIIGKIKLQIPVRQFRTAPWCIIIEHLYAVVTPKDLNDWDDESERISQVEMKLSELDSREMLWRAQKGYPNSESIYYAASYSNWLNYGTALATNIIENLELKINDVHIRYEDTITIPKYNFAAGIRIESLTLQSCDLNWTLGSKTLNEDIAYKLIELNNFAAYWDRMTDNTRCSNLYSKELLKNMCTFCPPESHHYIINPISARAQCKRERCKLPLRTRLRPRLSCNVIVSEVNMCLSDFQYQQIVGCFLGLQNIKTIRSFRILRPNSEVFGHVGCWWRYAAQCYGFNFENKNQKWQKLRENIRYIYIYKKLLHNPNDILREEKEFKSYVEQIRTLSELCTLREVCFNNVKTSDIDLHTQNINQGKNMLFHWFPNWWGWYGNTSVEMNQSQPALILDEEKYQNIEDDILNELEDSVGNNSYLKRDLVFGYFDFKLEGGQFNICSELISTEVSKIMLEMNFSDLNIVIETRPRSGSHLIGLSMGSVCLIDHLTPNTEFPDLIKPQMKDLSLGSHMATANNKQQFTSDNTETLPEKNKCHPWFQLQYEKRPISLNTDFRLLIKSRSLDIVYNKEAIKWIIEFFTGPFNTISGCKKIADKKKIVKPIFFKNWKNLFVDNLELRKTWSFEIDIFAPQIIVVDNFSDKNSAIVLIDFGRFQLRKSGLESRIKEISDHVTDVSLNHRDGFDDEDDDMFLTPCSTPPGSENSPSETPTVCFSANEATSFIINSNTGLESAFHKKIYDKYIIDLTDLQVLICKNRERNFASLKGSSIFHLLDKFNISLQLERRIIQTLDPEYPSLTLFGTLPKLVVHVNDHKINAVMDMLSLFSMKTSYDHNIENNKSEETLKSDRETDQSDGFNSNLIILQFVIDQLTLEVQSRDRSVAELQVFGVRAGLHKKPEETNFSLSVHGLLLVDAIQSYGPDFELLVASHRHVGMDSISGSLKQSEPCSPTSPASPDPTIYKQPTSPHIINKAIKSLQMENANSWTNLEDMDALIIVDVNYIKETIDVEPLQIANINFNNLDIIANQETIAELLAFMNRIVHTYKKKKKDEAYKSKSELEQQSNRENSNHGTQTHIRTEVSFDFHRLNILVLRALKKDNFVVGRKVGTFTMSAAKIHATLGKEISVSGSLGGLQILDVTPEGINHQRIFSVGKDPLTDPPDIVRQDLLSSLTQEMYGYTSKDKHVDQKDALMFQISRNINCVVNVKIRMASVWYTHCSRFLQELGWCANQFKHHIKNFAKSIRNKAADIAIEFVQQIHDISEMKEEQTEKSENRNKAKMGCNAKIKLDVILNSPVLVLPRSSQSSEVLVANLGKISIWNAEDQNAQSTKLDMEKDIRLLHSYFIDIKNINIFSLDTYRRKELRLSALPRVEEFYSCANDAVAILHDTAIQLVISNYSEPCNPLNEHKRHNMEFMKVEGSVTQLLKVSLSRIQYEQLLESLDNAFKVPTDIIGPYSNILNDLGDPTSNELENDDINNQEIVSINMRFKILFSLPVFVLALNNEHNNPLIEITFREFSIDHKRLNNTHTKLKVLLRSILMEDLKCAIDSKYRNMVDSTTHKKRNITKNNYCMSSSCPNLVNIHQKPNATTSMPENLQYIGYVSDSKPLVETFSDKIYTPCINKDDNLVTYIANIINPEINNSKCVRCISSSIDFNSLNLIISVERWFMVLDFFGLISDNESESKDLNKTKEQAVHCVKEKSDLKISIRSLNLTFVRKESDLAKANVSQAFFIINKHSDTKVIEGRLGSISLSDLTSFGKLYREKFLTSGTEALNFRYKRFSQIREHRSIEKDAVLQIQMSSVLYIHTKRFLMEIQSFIKEFLQLQTPVIKKMQSSDNDKSINQRPTQIGLEIKAASPIILLPVFYESNDLIVADLGEFTLINSFHYTSEGIVKSKQSQISSFDEIVDVMQIDLININFCTGQRIPKSSKIVINNFLDLDSFSVVKGGSNLLKDNCYLKLQLERNMDSNCSHNIPDVSVIGNLSKVSCILSLQQYKLLKGFLSYNMGENIEDVYKNHELYSQSIGKLNSTYKTYPINNESSVWNNLSIKMELEDVSVHLNFDSTYLFENRTLACINFIKSFLEIDSYSDGAQDIDLISNEILVTDARFTHEHASDIPAKNIFTEILKPSQKMSGSNIVQAEIHSRKRSSCTKYTVLLNNMRIMAILDWMESMKDYISEQIEPPIIESYVFDNNILVQSRDNINEVKELTYELILNITDSELVFLEKTNQYDTNAIILKSTTVFSLKPFDQNHPISVNLNHLEVFSCIFGFENESALSIIDPITLNVDLRNNKLDIILQKQLSIRLSYYDVKLFSKMLQSIPKQTRTAQSRSLEKKYTDGDFEIIAPLIAMGFQPKECMNAMEINNFQLNDAALWLSQHKQLELKTKALEIFSIFVSAQCISICIIDDCKDADVPLLEISLSRLSLQQILKENNEYLILSSTRSISGQLEGIIGSSYYNRRLSGWEPVIEPWECTSNWKYNKDIQSSQKNRFFSLELRSKQLLKLNITSTIMELCKIVRTNWTQDYYGGSASNYSNFLQTSSNHRRRTPFVPFALRNETGEILKFKVMLTQPGGITRTEKVRQDLANDWFTVNPDEAVGFSFGPQSKMRHEDSHRLNLHQILVEINGWTIIGPISIDKVGVFFRYSTEEESVRRSRIVFDITLIGSAQKLITVRSALRIVNKLNKTILIKIGPKENGNTYNLDPKKSYSVPLKKVESLIYIKPLEILERDEKNKLNYSGLPFEYCNHGISWSKCISDPVQEIFVCPGQNDARFNILVLIKRDKYHHRDFQHIPGHTITLMTPLTITNMLCCDLLYKISEHSQGRIHASDKANIYGINCNNDISINFTLDYYTVSGLLRIPANHVGIVEPKLKLLDLNNRELHLRASIQFLKERGMEIFISSPIWLVNKTGLPLIYKQEGVNQLASGQFEEHERARNITPLMFSFSDPDASPSMEIRLGKLFGDSNPWCKSFSLHKDIIHRQLCASESKGNYAIGIKVRRGRGRYACTNIVTLSPRFQLYNRSSHELQFAQKCDISNVGFMQCDEKLINAVPGCHFPFHWPNCDQEPLLCVRLADVEFCQWSSGIPINEVQSLYLNIRNDYGDMFFLRLEVILQGATYFLLFSDAHTLPPPIRIDNYSDVQLNFFQYGCKPQWNTTVRPHSSLAYALDDPTGIQMLQIEAPGGNLVDFPLNKLEMSCSLTYSNFIYIAFKETFLSNSIDTNNYIDSKLEIDNQNLVLGVKEKKVVLMRKCTGDRSQLWLMNSCGQLEHEGSSPPIDPEQNISPDSRMVLDLDKPPNPMDYTNLVVRPPNKQRETTQTWRFENDRLMCHANMCVQTRNGVFGLHPGTEAVLGHIESDSRTLSNNCVPIEQCIERQKLRPGSGHLEVISKMDGPILTIQIKDVKEQLDEKPLSPDPLWKHTSIIVTKSNEYIQTRIVDECLIKMEFIKGIGISLISLNPCEELVFITLQNLTMDYFLKPSSQAIEFKVKDIQIDNQLLDTSSPVVLYTAKSNYDKSDKNAITLNAKILPSMNKNAVIIEYISLHLKPYIVILDERLLLKIALFFGLGVINDSPSNIEVEYESHYFEKNILSSNSKRYYFENLYIGPCQIRLSVITSTKLSAQLHDVKKYIGLTLIKFEDAVLEFDKFSDRHHFETLDVYLTAIKMHYKNQIKWHAASILGSVDFLGNPLGFANDLSEGVSGLIFEGSVKSLVRNVTHGISNSTAKLTETLSDSLGRAVLDEQDNEARQKILEISSSSNATTEHLAAGLKGFGFGLLGGVTSIVRHTYVGAQTDGLHGFLSGFGKGIVGTVTKPIIGVLDLASETASAVRETSKGSHRLLPDRKRLPRCISGAPGGLLPLYSYRQSKGQQYLYIINRRSLNEHLISYEPNLCNDRDAKLRLLVSNEYIRIFSRCEEDPSIVLECHLSEVLSCHPLTANIGSSSNKAVPLYYIEISTNLPKITRPRIRCQNEEVAERAARYINYAKSVFDEREQTVIIE